MVLHGLNGINSMNGLEWLNSKVLIAMKLI